MINSKKIGFSLLIGILIISSLFLVPREYDVIKFKERQGTKYWDLKTGSKIGYTLIKGNQKEKRNPIIYLHGGPGGMIKDKIINALSPLSEIGHDLYFYDQVGSGHSSRLAKISAYTVRRHTKDLEEIVEKIASEKVILIGHSWGTMLAISYLIENKSSVEKMILSGPGPILPINYNLGKIEAPDSLNLRAPKYSNKEGNEKANNWRSKLMLKYAYLFNKKLGTDKEADDFFTYLNTQLSRSTKCDGSELTKYKGGGGYYAHIMTLKSFMTEVDEKQKLSGIKIPTLLIKGQCDNQKWGYTKEYLDLLPASRLAIIDDAGHDLISETRKEYLKLIIEFLK